MLRSWLLSHMAAELADEVLASPVGLALVELLTVLQDTYEYSFPADVSHAYFALLDRAEAVPQMAKIMTDEKQIVIESFLQYLSQGYIAGFNKGYEMGAGSIDNEYDIGSSDGFKAGRARAFGDLESMLSHYADSYPMKVSELREYLRGQDV